MSHQSIYPEECIAAIATGHGGSISIIRLSGREGLSIAKKIFWRSHSNCQNLPRRKLVVGKVLNEKGVAQDHCMAVYLPGPKSYTGEDMVEFHCHGGQMVAKSILALLLRAGVRHAEPGEFTKRAFLNGKLDLTQAEAVLDIIESQSEMALHAANRQLDGLLGTRVNEIYQKLINLLSEVEARLDFSDEDLEFCPVSNLTSNLNKIQNEIKELLNYRLEGEVLRNGIRIVIAGIPNAGKSSLLNSILGRNRAIVTKVPGTTRDTLEEFAQVRGIPIRFIDTAGLRDTNNIIEKEGIERTYSSIATAQLVLWVIDSTVDFSQQKSTFKLPEKIGVIAIASKVDLVKQVTFENSLHQIPLVKLSVKTGEGMDHLYDAIEELVWQYPHTSEPEVTVNVRHCSLLEKAHAYLTQALTILPNQDFEIVAVNLRSSLDSLGKITGKTIQSDILDTIFSKFCIGK